MSYHQITAAERYTLRRLRQPGLAPAAIARLMGRHRSTIGRELAHNRTAHDGAYRPRSPTGTPGAAGRAPAAIAGSDRQPGGW